MNVELGCSMKCRSLLVGVSHDFISGALWDLDYWTCCVFGYSRVKSEAGFLIILTPFC